MVSRRGDAYEVGDRAAAHEQAAGISGEVEHFREPADDLPFDEGRRLVVSRDVAVHRGGEQVRQQPDGRAVAHDPAPEARMNIARRIGKDVLLEDLVNLFHRRRFARQAGLERLTGVRGGALPDRPLADRLEKIDHIVEHVVAEGSKLVPVLGIERGVARRWIRIRGLHDLFPDFLSAVRVAEVQSIRRCSSPANARHSTCPNRSTMSLCVSAHPGFARESASSPLRVMDALRDRLSSPSLSDTQRCLRNASMAL